MVVTVFKEEVEISLCGPWCDIWSLGKIILDLSQGNDKAKGRFRDVSINSKSCYCFLYFNTCTYG